MSENRCVCCGQIIPAGSMVCVCCQKEFGEYNKQVTKKAKRRRIIKYLFDEWIVPLGLFAAIILFFLYIKNNC